jgi:hypothetical protein
MHYPDSSLKFYSLSVIFNWPAAEHYAMKKYGEVDV